MTMEETKEDEKVRNQHRKQQRIFIGIVIILSLIMIVSTGCSVLDAQNKAKGTTGQSDAVNDPDRSEELNENDLSPVPEEQPAAIKKSVALYFADRELMNMYRLEKEIVAKEEAMLPKAALEAWIAGPDHEELQSLVPPEVVVESVELKDGIAYVSLSPEIRNANLGSGGEMFLIDQIALIMQQFDCEATQLLVEGQAEESILGHVTTNEPIIAPDPKQYESFD